MKSTVRVIVAGLVLVVAAGCATGSAIRKGYQASMKGDWDAAVGYYREALAHDPNRIDVKVALERAMRNASGEHLRRARELESQDQLPGAIAEYRQAASLDPGNTLAATKAGELERRIRDQLEASRPKPRIDQLRQQAAQQGFPRLDPRTPLPAIRNTGSIRELLRMISQMTGIGVTYEQSTANLVDRPFPYEIQNVSVEEALAQIMSANRLTYKVIGPNTIFVYADTPQLRQIYEDQFVQPFMLSHADAAEVAGLLNQLLSQGATGSRPQIQVNKNGNMLIIKGTMPVLTAIDGIIRTVDKPRAEVMIEAEILEVNRNFLKQVGLDLNQWALGFTYSPELAPTGGAAFPPVSPPPINLNTPRQGVGVSDFYVTVPTGLVQFLESDARSKVLARPQIRGREGMTVTLGLGDDVPQPQTVFQSAAAGGIANVPTTQVQYRRVGVNLIFTPRVTYQDEIILENLQLEKSGLGPNLDVGGQTFPTFVTRTAQTTLRLRDGESNLLAGLIGDETRKTSTGFPGITGLPILRNIFGNTQDEVNQTDIVMIITPRIIRSHELTADDLKAKFVGVGQNFGSGGVPQLISPDAPAPPGIAPQGIMPPGAAQPGATPPPGQPTTPTLTTGTPARAPGVVPIQPVTPAGEPTGPPSQGKVIVSPPSAPLTTGAPYTVPISVEGVSQPLGVLSLTLTYDPTVLRAVNVVQGTHMQQGGATTTFAPKIDAATGRVDIAIARPFDRPGATGNAVVAAVAFEAIRSGTSPVTIQGVLTTTTGQSIPVQMVSGSVTVK